MSMARLGALVLESEIRRGPQRNPGDWVNLHKEPNMPRGWVYGEFGQVSMNFWSVGVSSFRGMLFWGWFQRKPERRTTFA